MIYTYKCETCDYTNDFEWEMDAIHPKRMYCPHCKTMTMYRLFLSPLHVPFQFTKDTYDFTKRPSHLKKYR